MTGWARYWDNTVNYTITLEPILPGDPIMETGKTGKTWWDAEFASLFRMSSRLMISAGYRQFKCSRKDGSGEDELKQTVTVIGPAIGLSIGIL